MSLIHLLHRLSFELCRSSSSSQNRSVTTHAMADTPLQVAILGAGGFVKDAYVNSLAVGPPAPLIKRRCRPPLPLTATMPPLSPQACSAKIVVTGLWSRSAASVSKLLPEIQA